MATVLWDRNSIIALNVLAHVNLILSINALEHTNFMMYSNGVHQGKLNTNIKWISSV